ncbi:DEAD/DEAH box helicase [Candidatus Peregrinibacteria bacterium]|nr:DEAD/DEAH box helicase [Candidatus Peregrinibacteria bacterium]
MRHRSKGGRRRPSNFRRKRGNSSKKIKGFDILALINNQADQNKKEVKEYICRNTFEDFDFEPKLKLGIALKGYVDPTPIQDQSIPHIMSGSDLVGIANTGTGKTAAFLLPMINKVMIDKKQKVLILAPTRELAFQIEKEFRSFTQKISVNSVLCIGGTNMGTQIRNLKRDFNFVIGTPGRVKDLQKRKLIDFENYRNVILDEVDQMMDMGFINEIREILSGLPLNRHSLFFSATISKTIDGLIQQFLNNPVKVSVKTSDTAVNVHQEIVRINQNVDKVKLLEGFLSRVEFEKVLVFGRTKFGVDKLCKSLNKLGFKADSIHGNKTQSKRQRALDSFKKLKVNVLVATDVASRGLDIDDVSHVINFDMPESREDYIHRIGRTGRGEKKGIALTFMN